MKEIQSLYLSVAICLMVATALNSCKEKKSSDDFDPPVITINLPDAGVQYNFSDTIFLDADIADESEIADITVRLIYGTDTVLIWPEAPVVFGNVNTFHLIDDVINNETVGATTPAILRFYAVDKHDNSSIEDVAVELL